MQTQSTGPQKRTWIITGKVSNSKHSITHTQSFYGSLDFVRDNPSEPVPEETFTHSHPSWSSNIPICFLHLLRSMAYSLFNQRTLQSFSTISLQVFFGLPLGTALMDGKITTEPHSFLISPTTGKGHLILHDDSRSQ